MTSNQMVSWSILFYASYNLAHEKNSVTSSGPIWGIGSFGLYFTVLFRNTESWKLHFPDSFAAGVLNARLVSPLRCSCMRSGQCIWGRSFACPICLFLLMHSHDTWGLFFFFWLLQSLPVSIFHLAWCFRGSGNATESNSKDFLISASILNCNSGAISEGAHEDSMD